VARITPRTWTKGLDNLGENLIRLGAALKSIEEAPGVKSDDTSFANALGQTATAFRVAFRQALPVLSESEPEFLREVPENPALPTPREKEEENLGRAHSLLHESILGSLEIVALLERLSQSERADPATTRQVMQGSLHQLAESTTSVGWELRSVCHEYASEARLTAVEAFTVGDLEPGAYALMHDMAGAARRMRAARRDWFRVEQHLAAATGSHALRRPRE
jgi:hypothetical protein